MLLPEKLSKLPVCLYIVPAQRRTGEINLVLDNDIVNLDGFIYVVEVRGSVNLPAVIVKHSDIVLEKIEKYPDGCREKNFFLQNNPPCGSAAQIAI